MPSTFLGIEIAKRSLAAHQQALNLVGHNIANANTEGYSRQRVRLEATEPDYPSSMNLVPDRRADWHRCHCGRC